MSFPRKSDVATHSARKPRRSPTLRLEIIPLEQVPTTDLKVLTDKPSSAPPSTSNPANPGEPR